MINNQLLHDYDYQDFRELICYERPACVLLHFQHRINGLRFLLADRILILKDNGKLQLLSNDLDQFLRSHQVISDVKLTPDLNAFEIENAFISEFSNRNAHALLLTYTNEVAGNLLMSTLLVEYHSDQIWKVSSLRGDEFYIRKNVSFSELYERLYIAQNGLEYQRLYFSDELLQLSNITIADFLNSVSIDARLEQIVEKLNHLKLEGKLVASQALFAQFEEIDFQSDLWQSQVLSGFKNVLLVKAFWPIQFYFQPFLVFVRNYLEQRPSDSTSEMIVRLLHEIKTKTEILTSLANKFGIAPQNRTLESFQSEFSHILGLVQQIEIVFFENYPSKKNVLSLMGGGPLSRSLDEMVRSEKIFLAPPMKGMDRIHLSDSTAANDVLSGYLSKDQVRQALKGSEFDVFYKVLQAIDDILPGDLPGILKSNFGWASGFVFQVNNTEQVIQSLAKIRQMHRLNLKEKTTAKILLEELLKGDEYAAELRFLNGQVQILGIFQKFASAPADFADYAYVLTMDKQAHLLEKFQDYFHRLADQLKLQNVYLHIEFRWDEQTRRFGLIEINFRMGGGGFLASIIHRAAGRNAIWSSSSNLVPTTMTSAKIYLGLVPHVQGRGLIKFIRGQDKIQQHPNVQKCFWLKSIGDNFAPPPQGFDYPAAIISQHESEDEMRSFVNLVGKEFGFNYV